MTALPSFRQVFVFCPCSAWLSAVLHITHVSDFWGSLFHVYAWQYFQDGNWNLDFWKRGLCSTGCTCHLPCLCHPPILFSLLLVPHKSFGYSGGWETYIDFKVRKFSVDEEWAGEEDLKVRHCVQTVVREEEEVCTPYYSGGCNNQQECRAHPRRARGEISNIPTTKKWWNVWGDGYDNCSSFIFAQDEWTGIKVEDFTALGSKFYTHLVHTIIICQIN